MKIATKKARISILLVIFLGAVCIFSPFYKTEAQSKQELRSEISVLKQQLNRLMLNVGAINSRLQQATDSNVSASAYLSISELMNTYDDRQNELILQQYGTKMPARIIDYTTTDLPGPSDRAYELCTDGVLTTTAYAPTGGAWWTMVGSMYPEVYYPEVLEYRIRWFDGRWGQQAFYPGPDEKWDWKNPDRHPSRYWDDHSYLLVTCGDEKSIDEPASGEEEEEMEEETITTAPSTTKTSEPEDESTSQEEPIDEPTSGGEEEETKTIQEPSNVDRSSVTEKDANAVVEIPSQTKRAPATRGVSREAVSSKEASPIIEQDLPSRNTTSEESVAPTQIEPITPPAPMRKDTALHALDELGYVKKTSIPFLQNIRLRRGLRRFQDDTSMERTGKLDVFTADQLIESMLVR